MLWILFCLHYVLVLACVTSMHTIKSIAKSISFFSCIRINFFSVGPLSRQHHSYQHQSFLAIEAWVIHQNILEKENPDDSIGPHLTRRLSCRHNLGRSETCSSRQKTTDGADVNCLVLPGGRLWLINLFFFQIHRFSVAYTGPAPGLDFVGARIIANVLTSSQFDLGRNLRSWVLNSCLNSHSSSQALEVFVMHSQKKACQVLWLAQMWMFI